MQSISLFRRVGALVALLVLLASCAQPTPSEAPPEPAAAPNAPTSAGGTLIMVFGSRDPSTIDPALVGDVQSAFIVRQLFSGLVRLDENMDVQPDLAERWELSDDGRTYTFVLRESLTFADGSPLTSADVIYSLERASDPSLSPFLPAQTYLGDIVGVPEKLRGEVATISGLQAPDERTVAITIDAPKSYFLAKLAHPTSFVVDQQQVEGDPRGWLDAPNAAGPFVIERWENDALMDLRRNDQFHRELARLDRVRLLIGANANNPLILYEQGDIDVTSVPAFALARVRDQSNPLSTQLVQVPQLSLFYLGMNVEIPPFDDPKIREAFSLLIDRERLAILTLADSASAARGILPPGMPGYNEELPLPQANIEAARQLIRESSYGVLKICRRLRRMAAAGQAPCAMLPATNLASVSKCATSRVLAISLTRSRRTICRSTAQAGSPTTPTRKTSSICSFAAVAAKIIPPTPTPKSMRCLTKRRSKPTKRGAGNSIAKSRRRSSPMRR